MFTEVGPLLASSSAAWPSKWVAEDSLKVEVLGASFWARVSYSEETKSGRKLLSSPIPSLSTRLISEPAGTSSHPATL